MTAEKHMCRWVGRNPCECGKPFPADVFDWLDSPAGKRFAGRLPDPQVVEEDDEEPIDQNREGDPAFNGAFDRW